MTWEGKFLLLRCTNGRTSLVRRFASSTTVLEHPSTGVVREAGRSRQPKQPRVEQRWYGNLQHDAQALVVLLQVKCVECDSREVTFEACLENLNNDQYKYCLS